MSNNNLSAGENLNVAATPNQENIMVHRVNTNLTETLETHSDVKKKPTDTEKASATAIDIPSRLDEKTETYSDIKEEQEEEHVKKTTWLKLFYMRHLPWFQ